jgi:CBS domain-containing protein
MVTARDIMTREVETVSPDDDVSEVLTRLARADFNGFPVTEDGIVVGIVTQGDLVDLFQPSDRTLWIPIGFPPFLESLTYAIDLSWDELDVGIVTQGDLVDLFQPSDRTLWIPIGFPPFLESLTYAIDLSWDELDVGIDMAKNAGRSISEVMTEEVVTVGPKTDIDEILALIADEDRDINRLPVVDEAGALMGIIARQDVLRTLKEERDASKPTDV